MINGLSKYFRFSIIILLLSAIFSCQRQDPSIAQMQSFIDQLSVDKTKPSWQMGGIPQPPQLNFLPHANYIWHLQTNVGDLFIQLKAQQAPMHVSSTIYLTMIGFYNGLTFHRVIPGFMAQGGDPLGNGQGGPGYTYMGEFDNKLSHNKVGILSMANAGAGTDGSQFFITFKPVPFLDGRHSVFGEVIRGLDTLKRIEQLGSSRGTTVKPVILEKATIELE